MLTTFEVPRDMDDDSLCMLLCWSLSPPDLACSFGVVVVEQDPDWRLEVLSGLSVDSSSIFFRKGDVGRDDSSIRRKGRRRRHVGSVKAEREEKRKGRRKGRWRSVEREGNDPRRRDGSRCQGGPSSC